MNPTNAAAEFPMPLGEVMFSMRAMRRLKPDPVPEEDIRLLLEAAIQAPSPSNRQACAAGHRLGVAGPGAT